MGDDKDGKKGSKNKLKRKAYEKELAKLQAELVNLQEWVKLKGLKVCIVFEGRDAAGKGGTIKAITERVSPRVFRVVALPAPTERERSQMCKGTWDLGSSHQPLSRTIFQTTRSESGSRSRVGGNTVAISPSLFARTLCSRRSFSLRGSPGKYICVITRLTLPVTSK